MLLSQLLTHILPPIPPQKRLNFQKFPQMKFKWNCVKPRHQVSLSCMRYFLCECVCVHLNVVMLNNLKTKQNYKRRRNKQWVVPGVVETEEEWRSEREIEFSFSVNWKFSHNFGFLLFPNAKTIKLDLNVLLLLLVVRRQ